MLTNARALTRILLMERPSLLRLAERIVRDKPMAEDVTQSLWLKVQGIDDDPPIANRRAYLFRLATNMAIDRLKAMRRQNALFVPDDFAEQVADDMPLPEKVLLDREALDQVRGAIEELSPVQGSAPSAPCRGPHLRGNRAKAWHQSADGDAIHSPGGGTLSQPARWRGGIVTVSGFRFRLPVVIGIRRDAPCDVQYGRRDRMTGPREDHSGPDINRTAAHYFAAVEAGEMTPDEEAELAQWLAADTRHADAFGKAATIWASLDGMPIPAPISTSPSLWKRKWYQVALAASVAILAVLALTCRHACGRTR
jgi:RNA polymerase sigma-70 factor (ECF subfamily)